MYVAGVRKTSEAMQMQSSGQFSQSSAAFCNEIMLAVGICLFPSNTYYFQVNTEICYMHDHYQVNILAGFDPLNVFGTQDHTVFHFTYQPIQAITQLVKKGSVPSISTIALKWL